MPLLRPSVRPPEQEAAAQRVRGLLTPPARGWLPPEQEPSQGPGASLEGGPSGAQGPRRAAHRAPAGRPWLTGRSTGAPRSPADETAVADLAEQQTRVRGDEGRADVEDQACAGAGDGPPATADPAWLQREPAPQVPDDPVAGVLERLRAGRLDPGRRAVAGLALVGLLAALVTGALVLRGRPREVVLPQVERAGRVIADATLPSAVPSAPAGGVVVVAVAGRVRRPGLVRLPAGSRVDDALRAAGGVAPGASPGLLNLARTLVDGEQVLVGVEAPAGASAGAGAAGAGAPGTGGGTALDLNAATAEDLDQLPGIGPVLAERIVDYRTRSGPFRSVDQLREVSGIGEAKYASLKDAVRV